MVLLKAGVAIVILAAIMYAWKRKLNLKKRKETEELLKIEEEVLASMAHEKEGKIFTMDDINEEPKDEQDNWEPMKIQFEEEHKCNCGHCHHEEEEHECCGKCHEEEEHECSGECDGCNHCEIKMIEEDLDVIADRIVFVNDGPSSSNKYHKAADSHGMDGAIKMSETEALEKGFVPCARCFGKCKK